MRFLFVMDPMDRLVFEKDTTYAFQRAGQKRGNMIFFSQIKDIFSVQGQIFARAKKLNILENAPWFKWEPISDHHKNIQGKRGQSDVSSSRGEPRSQLSKEGLDGFFPLADFDAVFIRKDPPFDANYLYLTQLLDLAKTATFVVNDPGAVRDANEKLYALHFAANMPQTIVTADMDRIYSFVREVGGKAVIKPLDGAGGSGVMILDQADKNRKAIVEQQTLEGRRWVMVQAFLPAVRFGDKRVLLLDGKILGAINRVASDDEFRSNIHVGGRVEACSLDSEEEGMVLEVASKLKQKGLYFVGLDLIGKKITEINVTSPTGIQELSQHVGKDVADDVIRWVEDRVKERRLTVARD